MESIRVSTYDHLPKSASCSTVKTRHGESPPPSMGRVRPLLSSAVTNLQRQIPWPFLFHMCEIFGTKDKYVWKFVTCCLFAFQRGENNFYHNQKDCRMSVTQHSPKQTSLSWPFIEANQCVIIAWGLHCSYYRQILLTVLSDSTFFTFF